MGQSAIILVETDPFVREAFAAFAEAMDYRSVQFGSLQGAVENAQPAANDVLIVDLHAAGDVRQFLAWRTGMRAPPATIIVTCSSPAIVRHILGEGLGIAVVRKPVDAHALLALIRSRIGGPA
jgi:DNA-binding response OmpR family regulator